MGDKPKVYHSSAKTGGSDIWGTPRELFDVLDREFGFTLDACATAENAKLPRFFSPEDNGLEQSWKGERVFCNPPYSEIEAWARKAAAEALGGSLVVLLVPARTGSRWFWQYLTAGEVRFLTRRLRFEKEPGKPGKESAPFDSAIVILGHGREPGTHYWNWEEEAIPELPREIDDRDRPALRYYGSKFSLAPWIVDLFPRGYERLHYIEPYGGAASVLFRKKLSKLETYNDLNGDLVTFFRVLRERPGELIAKLRLTPYARAEYYESIATLAEGSEDEIEIARAVFVQYWQGIQGSNSRSGWRVMRDPEGRNTKIPRGFEIGVLNLYRVAERLRKVQIENIDALDLIRRSDSADSLFYVDPPYPLETRRYSSPSYAFEMEAGDHVELAKTLRKLSGYCLISTYDSDLYRELYESAEWERREIDARINGGGIAREVLYLNPRLSSELSRNKDRRRISQLELAFG